MAFFDSDAAAKRVNYMWRKLGGLYEKAAYEHAEKLRPHAAMECARMADVCFWQATGEADQIQMKHVAKNVEPSDDR